jgi:tight adherence protein C
MFSSLNSQQVWILVFGAVAVALAVVGVAMIVLRTGDIRGRAMGNQFSNQFSSTGVTSGGAWGGFLAVLAKATAPFAKWARPKEAHEISGLKAKFAQAGWRSQSAMALYFGLRAILALLLPFVVLIVLRVSGANISNNKLMMFTLILAALGYYLPTIFFNRVRINRQTEIFQSFPDAIDLMVVCVESGLGLDMAIARTGKEMHVRSAALADELNLIGIELRMGASRERSLRNFAARTGLSEISMFCAMILQADRFGTSIADALRVHADELRLRRRLVAEEKAAKIPLKLLFPLIFMIFPSLLLVLLGPAFISIMKAFAGMAK